MVLRLKCSSCGHRFTVVAGVTSWLCPKCGGLPEADYGPEWRPEGRGLARYSASLPITPKISLGEGSTPLIFRRFYGVNTYFKLEYLNPSGSFKDRGTALAMTHVIEAGASGVVEDTSGNTGISVATYSATYGIKAVIVVPRTAPEGKKGLLRALGAEVVEAPSRGDAALLAPRIAEEVKGLHVGHTVNPLYIEGAKTLAYEAYEQGFRGDEVIVPVGSGGLALGVFKGFRELVKWGLLDSLPHLHVAEDASLTRVDAPVKIGWGRDEEGGGADALLVPEPPRIKEVADVTALTRGSSVAVSLKELREALRELYSMGFIVEPTSAAPLAALKLLIDEGIIDRGSNVLIPLTGSGLKVIATVSKMLGISRR